MRRHLVFENLADRQQDRFNLNRERRISTDSESSVGEDISLSVLEEHERRLERNMEAEARRGIRNIKLRPPQFSGKRNENVKQFFSKFTKYAEHQGIAEEDMVEATSLVLEGDALEMYDSLVRNNADLDYEGLKDTMIAHYDEDKIDFVVRSRINKRMLKSNESVTDYFNDLRKEAMKIDLGDEALLYAFIEGLPAYMAEHIVCQNPRTPTEALNCAKTLEQIKQMYKQTEKNQQWKH